MANILHTSDGNFTRDITAQKTPVLVDFWAPWCTPCKMLGPEIEAVSQELNDKLTVMKMNTDENPEVATQMGIRGIPTMILFKDGKEVHRLVGLRDRSALKSELSPFLN